MPTAQETTGNRVAQQEYGHFIDQLSDPVLIVNNAAAVLRGNQAAVDWFRIGPEDHTRFESIFNFIPELMGIVNFPLFARDNQSRDITLVHNNQDVLLRFNPYFDGQNHLLVLPGHIVAQSGGNLLQLVLESIPARVFWKDLEGKYLGCNTKFASDAGKKHSSELVGLCDQDIFPIEGAMYAKDDFDVMSTGTAKLNIEEPQTNQSGNEIWLSTNKVPIRNEFGDVIGVMGSYTDITERIRHQQIIERQARFDHLTGLPNRLALQEKLLDFEQNSTVLNGGLLFIDLDHFKSVNDSLGHAVGDQILIEVASRINLALGPCGFVVRLGGDEFSVLVSVGTDETCVDIKGYLLSIANSIRQSILQSFRIDAHVLRLGVSIGITLIDESTTDWSSKFNEADIAMYEAKATGRNRVLLFDEAMRQKLELTHSIQSRLQNACENNEFYLVIQPQFDSENNCLGGEVLLRWENPDLGLVSPAEFIPICEQSGLIHKVGLMVFEKAFELIANWCEQHGQTNVRPLAVNVSAQQFQVKSFIDDIHALLQKLPIDPSLIQFELTESLLLENQNDAMGKIRQLEAMGFSLAIDDFGTGYSCLSYLSKLPIEKIKIDQSFTNQINDGTRQAAIVETIITMAKNLEMTVIAEGVETQKQLDCLKIMGCDEFQGYLLSRPIPIDEYSSLVFSK